MGYGPLAGLQEVIRHGHKKVRPVRGVARCRQHCAQGLEEEKEVATTTDA